MVSKVSVIFTVLNESETIGTLLDSLRGQTRQPDEVVVVDGGSSDGTLKKLERFSQTAPFPVKVLSRPGCNISEGRNAAIAVAQGPIIAATDAGVQLDDGWLYELTIPFEASSPPDVVGGFFVSAPQSLFELALGAVTLPQLREIDPDSFYPSSRSVAFYRQAWQSVGGYPEWLDYCEDLLYDFALYDADYTFRLAPAALVHFRPRPTLKAFFKQYYRYARGDGKADFWRYRHLVRYMTYLVGLPFLLALALIHHPFWWLVLAAGFVGIMYKPFRRLHSQLKNLSSWERLLTYLWTPVICCTGDIAKMIGYPVGVWWRWRHAPKEPWPKRQF